MSKKAIITGITGQDGFYLSDLLLKQNIQVIGIKRRTSLINSTARIDSLINNNNFSVVQGDLSDSFFLNNLINQNKPDYIFNLAAMSHVKTSFDIPIHTGDINAIGTIRLLDAIRTNNLSNKTRFYQASTSEMFGNNSKKKLNEQSKLEPVSPYGASKLYAYNITKIYRQSYNIFACNGILFNHESPLRGETFVTRKIVRGAVSIVKNKSSFIELGNLNSVRDWGHAKDYCEAMIKIIMYKKPDDFVISSDKVFSVREFCKKVFNYLGLEIKFVGKGLNEVAIVTKSEKYPHLINKKIIKVNKKYFRPLDLNYLRGNSAKAKKILKWKPKINIDQLVSEMINYDLDLID